MDDAAVFEPKPSAWALDVDGVLNGLNKGAMNNLWGPENVTSYSAMTPWGTFKINWARQVAEFVRAVHEGGHAKVVWLTTWVDYANPYIGVPLGFPELEVLPRDTIDEDLWGTSKWWWKEHSFLDAEIDYGKIVWTDDDLSRASVSTETWNRPELLKIIPSTSTGLHPKNLQRIAEFLGCEDLLKGVLNERSKPVAV